MLPFFARTLTRREMALGCAVLSLALLLSALPAALRWGQAQLDTGALLCADTLRFHIRADSDSPADQTVKLAVRDAVLAYADARCTAQDKPAALRWAAENLPALELTARAVLARRGIFSTVTVQLVEMYFDTTRYSTGILPAGRYQALRIDLGGNARHGKNWWCVLYPGLCRSACGTYALREENDLVCGSYVVRFKCVEWWQRVTASREDSLGLSRLQAAWHIVLPQAMKNILPAIGNEMIALLKETAVAGYVAVQDLTRAGNLIRNNTYDAFNPLLLVAVVYLLLVIGMTQLLGLLERRLRRSDQR